MIDAGVSRHTGVEGKDMSRMPMLLFFRIPVPHRKVQFLRGGLAVIIDQADLSVELLFILTLSTFENEH